MPAEAANWVGRVIDGRYVVDGLIGQGGMGVVLRARHKFTSAQVALKMLQQDLQVTTEVRERFLAEARTPSTIGHPGIVQVLDAGTTAEGELYFAMELLSGRTLRQALYPSLPPQVARRITLELLDALGAAHARGIIHRDLKPENVFLAGPTNTVKLLDFGIAKVIQTARTHQGAMLGTLSYMSPEQVTDASSVDARTDLWAVGVMLYEMLCGQLPYRATTLVEVIQAFHSRDADPIRQHVPPSTPWLDNADPFFARALARDRTRRFSSTQELAAAIASLGLDETQVTTAGSTLTGVMAVRGSHQLTAADSGPSLPRTGSSPVAQPYQNPSPIAARAHGTGSPAPRAVPHGTNDPFPPPSAMFGGAATIPVAASPSAPFAVPAHPSAPFAVPAHPSTPFAVPAPPSAPYAPPQFVPPQRAGAWLRAAPPRASSGLGSLSWIVICVVVLAFFGLIGVFMKMSSETDSDVVRCTEKCKALHDCGTANDSCAAACTLYPTKASECVDSSLGSCDAFRTCVGP